MTTVGFLPRSGASGGGIGGNPARGHEPIASDATQRAARRAGTCQVRSRRRHGGFADLGSIAAADRAENRGHPLQLATMRPPSPAMWRAMSPVICSQSACRVEKVGGNRAPPSHRRAVAMDLGDGGFCIRVGAARNGVRD